jgi:osmotically-inducible protein OsmY
MKTDANIQKDVMNQLRWEPTLHAAEIGVAVHNGIVTLSGQVEKYSMKVVAEQAAKRVKGVRAVAQEMEVRLPKGNTSDEAIAQAILNTFHWHTQVPEDQVQVKVEHGWVTLSGEVEWHFQRLAAENAVLYLEGVKGIINQIKIKPQLDIQDVKYQIKEALKRSAIMESERIDVEMQGSTVVLRGVVQSWSERTEIENAAWSAPGVMQVEDKLVVAH